MTTPKDPRAAGAGHRAQLQAQRAAARVERLHAGGAGGDELAAAQRRADAWTAGACGEQAVARLLEPAAAYGWLALHDVHWPGRPKANLDHVMVGPGGVVVIDAKNWAGQVNVTSGVLRQSGYRRDRETAAALTQAAATAALLEPRHRRLVQGWIGLVQQPTINTRTADGARVVGHDVLLGELLALPVVLDALAVTAVHGHLTRTLAGPREAAQITTAAVPATGTTRRELSAAQRRPARRISTPPAAPRPATHPARRRTHPRPARGRRPSLGDARTTIAIVILLLAVTQLMSARGR